MYAMRIYLIFYAMYGTRISRAYSLCWENVCIHGYYYLVMDANASSLAYRAFYTTGYCVVYYMYSGTLESEVEATSSTDFVETFSMFKENFLE